MLLGPPPQVFLAAAAPVPYDVDELEVAAKLAGQPIEMRPCKHIDLQVPASTEIVIEGRFLPNVRRPEGPFGEFMGYYVPVGRQRRLRGARRVDAAGRDLPQHPVRRGRRRC